MKNLFVNIENGIVTLTLNRPEVSNAFDDNLINSLLTELINIDSDPSIKVVVLKSTGKHFSAGADLAWMQRMANLSENENLEDAKKLSALMHQLNNLTKPTVVLINGAAFGGALGLITCCDIAIAMQRSKFCLSEVKIGLTPAVISPYVISAMGERQARRYFLTAEVFNADAALKLGIIHEIVNDEFALEQTKNTIINHLLINAPQAMTVTKNLIKTVTQTSDAKAVANYTTQLIARLRTSEEGQEGLNAFLEKRLPSWGIHTKLNKSEENE